MTSIELLRCQCPGTVHAIILSLLSGNFKLNRAVIYISNTDILPVSTSQNICCEKYQCKLINSGSRPIFVPSAHL